MTVRISDFARLFFRRFAGRLVCRAIGSHTPDWTWAHMNGSRPVCGFCRRQL